MKSSLFVLFFLFKIDDVGWMLGRRATPTFTTFLYSLSCNVTCFTCTSDVFECIYFFIFIRSMFSFLNTFENISNALLVDILSILFVLVELTDCFQFGVCDSIYFRSCSYIPHIEWASIWLLLIFVLIEVYVFILFEQLSFYLSFNILPYLDFLCFSYFRT